MLSNTERAYLSNALHVPSVISDILDKQEDFNDATRFAMHDDMSEKQPDTALLTIAISALIIANRYKNDSPNLSILNIEANRIIDEYGSLWLKNAQKTDLNEDDIFDVLFHTAEDLDGLAELLEYNCKLLQRIDTKAAELCELLQIQAKAHSLIAEEFIALADELIATQETPEKLFIETTTQEYKDNVINFPNART